jgi:hypothetical protein
MRDNNNPSVQAFKVWIFPSLVSVIALLIWNDVNEIKSDVKALMAQSNIDKTRIDNIERFVYKTASASVPSGNTDWDYTYKLDAALPNNKLIIKK